MSRVRSATVCIRSFCASGSWMGRTYGVALAKVQLQGVSFAVPDTSYFLCRETLIATDQPGMAIWREKLFASLAANARSAASYFRLPPTDVVELGSQIQL